MSTLLCLSSGIRPRYLQDVLRVVSMPVGSRLRFRYNEDLVPAELRETFREHNPNGTDVLIAYLARYDKLVAPTAVPLRGANLIRSKVIGRIIVLDFELLEFKIADDLKAFNQALRTEINFPRWENGELVGMFCDSFDKALSYVKRKAEVKDWQELVSDLHKYADFTPLAFFISLMVCTKPARTNLSRPQRARGH